jgi:hypothetical protein
VGVLGAAAILRMHAEGRAYTSRWDQRLVLVGGPALPQGLDVEVARPPVGYGDPAYTIAAPSAREGDPDDMVTVTPSQAVSTVQGFALAPSLHIGHPILADCAPPPEPWTELPVDQVRRFEAEGWRVALPPNVGRAKHDPEALPTDLLRLLRPLRQCQRCHLEATPIAVPAAWPADATPGGGMVNLVMAPRSIPMLAEGEAVDYAAEYTEVSFALVHSTKLCCPGCHLPYPGPEAVPMYRRPGGLPEGLREDPYADCWSFMVVTSKVYRGRVVTPSALRLTREVMQASVWRDLYQEALSAHTPWVCGVPGCGGPAHRWVVLTGSLAWQGYLWSPTDGVPLRMGLCHAHHAGLVHDATRYVTEQDMMGMARRYRGVDHARNADGSYRFVVC